MAELLPCPFCGNADLWPTIHSTTAWQVECRCGVVGAAVDGKENAVAAWNTRASPGAAQTREGAPEALTDELVLQCYHDAFRHTPASNVHNNLLFFAAHLRAALKASQPVDGVQGGEG